MGTLKKIDQNLGSLQDKEERLEDALRYDRKKKYWIKIITGKVSPCFQTMKVRYYDG